MFDLRTEVQINASAEDVWAILIDLAAYGDWNPFVRRAEGKLEVGEILSIEVKPEGGSPMSFKPTLIVASAPTELRWKGKLIVPGLFDGEHYFRIEPINEKSVRFVHGEIFNGVLIPLAKSTLNKGTKAGFIAMNEALKLRAENLSSGSRV